MGRFREGYKLFSTNTTLGWKVINRISAEKGEEMVRNRMGRQVLNTEKKLIGYQMFDSTLKPVPVITDSLPSSTVLSRAETEAVVGLRGESRTAGMGEIQRIKRIAEGRRDMDLVESSCAKFAAFIPQRATA